MADTKANPAASTCASGQSTAPSKKARSGVFSFLGFRSHHDAIDALHTAVEVVGPLATANRSPSLENLPSVGESASGTDPLATINDTVHSVLYETENERWSKFWSVIEDVTQCRRETVAYAMLGVFSALMIWGSFGELVCALFGVVYPSVATMQLLSPAPGHPPASAAARDHWLRYWSVFGFVTCVDILGQRLFSLLPAYQICKVLFLLAASWPDWPVSHYVYGMLVAPVVKWSGKLMHKYVFGYDKPHHLQTAVERMPL